MKWKCETCVLLVLVAVTIQLLAQQGEPFRKSFEDSRTKAEQGDVVAQSYLGFCYANGHGVAKDAVEAVKWFRKAAAQNYADAQFNLGVIYANGLGVPKDAVEAVGWFRKAADKGNPKAQYNLAHSYADGQGVAKNSTEALIWYRKAAEQGFADAQYNLGVIYGVGRGVPQDYSESVKWYRKAAEQGVADAQGNLGLCYANGQGVLKNEAEAVRWYRKAAEQNAASAQFNLGLCYYDGNGVVKDKVQAYKWFNLSAAQGAEQAKTNLSIVEQSMTLEQIAEAQRLSREFKSREETKSDKEGDTPVSGWKRYSSQEGGFSVEFPAAPETKTVRGRINDARFQDATFLSVEKGEAAYSVAYSDEFDDVLREFSINQILDAARDGALATTQGKLLLELAISKDGFQGREIVFLTSGLSSRVRIYLVGNRKYVVGVVGQGANYAKTTEAFLSSFQFLPTLSPPR